MTTNTNVNQEVKAAAVVKRAFKLFDVERKRGDKLTEEEVSKLSARHRAALENSGKVIFVKSVDDLLKKPTIAAGAGNARKPLGLSGNTPKR